ncbi:hypothetical protein VARIO8X_160241 [Burkholderiales bacterium 8X]|nr:hypothetical protein VARIO8X_160241 [Burkholderiales bacterium 8X]
MAALRGCRGRCRAGGGRGPAAAKALARGGPLAAASTRFLLNGDFQRFSFFRYRVHLLGLRGVD